MPGIVAMLREPVVREADAVDTLYDPCSEGVSMADTGIAFFQRGLANARQFVDRDEAAGNLVVREAAVVQKIGQGVGVERSPCTHLHESQRDLAIFAMRRTDDGAQKDVGMQGDFHSRQDTVANV